MRHVNPLLLLSTVIVSVTSLCAASPCEALGSQVQVSRPGIAVFPLVNGGSYGAKEQEDLNLMSLGLQQSLINELAVNTNLRVIDRAKSVARSRSHVRFSPQRNSVKPTAPLSAIASPSAVQRHALAPSNTSRRGLVAPVAVDGARTEMIVVSGDENGTVRSASSSRISTNGPDAPKAI